MSEVNMKRLLSNIPLAITILVCAGIPLILTLALSGAQIAHFNTNQAGSNKDRNPSGSFCYTIILLIISP
ncbi:exported hypothetical protein [Vibrio nigripulchritudo SOn1]|uniref:Uncharacterized protein n=1 Tax=Vibrio nigripulchritudo SOn1 TaxID=1238450 RepID=A0AAV2VRY6_9VIBR|nr:exported hypothetical protein [Vibrio nigripulchritudo SOn1]